MDRIPLPSWEGLGEGDRRQTLLFSPSLTLPTRGREFNDKMYLVDALGPLNIILKAGTLNGILKDIASHLEIEKEDLIRELFYEK